MNDYLTKREQLSALADGELSAAELQAALAYAQSDAGQQEWRMYHLVGDVLRSPELAHHSRHDLLSGIRSQLANEPRRPLVPVAADELEQVARPAHGRAVVNGAPLHDAANASVFRWKMAAGFASVAAVAAIGWSVMLGAPAGPGAAPGRALAALETGAPAAAAVAGNAQDFPLGDTAQSSSVVAVAGPYGQSVMLRDPRLDALLASHPQYSGPATLQMPASFLRNANFASAPRANQR
ncbi:MULTISPECIES: sigma-E factor negative regulatory protein [unclassified Delftia]|uniref:sigma-E factor negative regulatory protein n=1 Tax=unclassified Delftia TaxID=2613839 RepID=UPI0006487C26|nr:MULTISPECIES: sigma-E factor negative regulatory protein [unclassified Delftia]MDC2859262.1 sigma-E factor negative regulatory protein [Delftia sp. DT-2]